MILEQFDGFLKTAALWENNQFGIRQFKFPECRLNDFEASPIPKKLRLGHQMEAIFKQLIVFSKQYQIVLHNLAVRKENITLGEIDFILKEITTSQIVHVELTYKFYIIDTSISEPIHRLIGPNRRDMFFTKMEKIKNQQFPLLHSPEGAKALLENGLEHQNIEHQCCFKAQLFIPFNSPYVPIRPLNKDCVQGFWLRFDDFNAAEFQSYQYYIPHKKEWVINPHGNVDWQSHYEIVLDLNLRMLEQNAPMVWMRKSHSKFKKFFVVWW